MKKILATVALATAALLPATSAHAADSARAGVYRCGGTGIIVWYYDLQNRYHEPVNTCL